MKSISHLPSTLLLLATLASAQTWPGFEPSTQNPLDVIYGTISLTNGQQLPRPSVLMMPQIQVPEGNFSETGRAVLVMLDSDVPSNGSRVNLLHWIAPDITGSAEGASPYLALPPNGTGVPYLPPNPPQGDYPHRYSFLLFEQTRSFAIPESVQAAADNTSLRRGFNLTAFLADSGLNEPMGRGLIAANYMLVANTSGDATTSFPPAAYTASSTLAPMPTGSATTMGGGGVETPASTTSEGGSSASETSGSGSSGSATGSESAAVATSTGGANLLEAGSTIGLVAAIFGFLMM